MATVNKDFRIKAGLVVEGANATVNGEDIITTGSSTDNLQEGTTNLYFTNQRALDAVGGDISSAVSTAINALTTDDIEEGISNLYFTEERAQDAIGAAVANSTQTGITVTYDDTDGELNFSVADQWSGKTTDDLTEGATNQYFTNQRALDATASAYDAAGSASSAQAAAQSYADGLAVNYDAAGAAATAESNANSYTDTAVANLVDGAPALLDTLNELAAAINDDASFASTITTSIGEKVAKSGDTMTGELVLAADPTQALAAATKQYVDTAATNAYNDAIAQADTTAQGYANTAENNAEAYADSLAVNYEAAGSIQTAINALTTSDVEEGTNLYFTDERAIDAVSAADIYPNAVIVNNVSKQVANTQSVATASTVSGLTWAKADYKSAKLVVKAATATHSQVSEIMVTLDSLDNVAITEFGIVYTDAELATVTADVSGTDVRIRVTTLNATTSVTVVGSLLV